MFFVIPLLFAVALTPATADKPLTPVEARSRIGQIVVVEMIVKVAKDRLEKRGEVYLDSEEDFRDPKNFAAVISRAGAAKLREMGVDDPAAHFQSKRIRVKGSVTLVDGVPRIEIDETTQINIVESK